MSKKTKMKRAEKESKRLPSTYQSPVKDKPRETAWKEFRDNGTRYKD